MLAVLIINVVGWSLLLLSQLLAWSELKTTLASKIIVTAAFTALLMCSIWGVVNHVS